MSTTEFGKFEKVLRFGEGRRAEAAQAAGRRTSRRSSPTSRRSRTTSCGAKTAEFRERLANGESLDELLFEAFAAVREARWRESQQRMFDVQMMGGIVLHEGDIAEMKTGEGKTFVASTALYLNALAGDRRPPRDRERLPRQARRRVEPRRLRAPRDDGRLHPEHDAVRHPQGRVRGRRHLRHQLRVRLRLPPRQHGRLARQHRPAQPRVRDRGRGRLDPDRRGAHAADHLRRAGDGGEHVPRLRADREGPPRRADHAQGGEGRGRDRALGRRLHLRREAQDRLARADRPRRRRARARDREPLRPASRAARQPPQPGAEGRVALQARRRLRDRGRRGEDRRRVHGPDHGGPPLERGPAPGDRGEGGRPDPRGERHARDDHAPELLPPLREARRHDRHREDRGEGVRRDLQPPRRRDPDERRRDPQGRERLHLQDARKRSGTPSPRTSSSGTRRASRCSSARSRSRPPSTCPSS